MIENAGPTSPSPANPLDRSRQKSLARHRGQNLGLITPRPVGSLLCCNEDGHVAGSLSGGCIEEDLLEKITNGELATTKPEVMLYGKTTEESERFGLPCGGQLHIVVEPQMDKSNLPQFEAITSRLAQRECIERKVDIATGEITVEDKERFKHMQFTGEFENSDTPNEKFLVQTYGPQVPTIPDWCRSGIPVPSPDGPDAGLPCGGM